MAEQKTLRRYDVITARVFPSLVLYGWQCHKGNDPQANDLVILTSAPPTEWALSFYRELLPDGRHLLESVRTGALCRWDDVGFMVIDKDKVGITHDAYWSDDQFAFHDKFRKAWKKGGFYIAVPYIEKFDGDAVHMGFRTRWGLNDIITPFVVEAWKKVTQKALLARMKEAETEHESKQPKREPRHG
jgi:hypothetical protein